VEEFKMKIEIDVVSRNEAQKGLVKKRTSSIRFGKRIGERKG